LLRASPRGGCLEGDQPLLMRDGGIGAKSMPSIQLKTAAFAPMPSVRQRIARMENPGLRRRMRRPKRMSCRKLSIKFYLAASAAFLLRLLGTASEA